MILTCFIVFATSSLWINIKRLYFTFKYIKIYLPSKTTLESWITSDFKMKYKNWFYLQRYFEIKLWNVLTFVIMLQMKWKTSMSLLSLWWLRNMLNIYVRLSLLISINYKWEKEAYRIYSKKFSLEFFGTGYFRVIYNGIVTIW